MVVKETKQEVISMIDRIKKWLSKYLSITIEFNKVDIDTVDYENGQVAVAVASDGTKITVYDREDWFCSDPVFAYTWEKNIGGVVTSGSSRVSYYKLKDYKFKVVKVPSFDEWQRSLDDKEVRAKKMCEERNPGKFASYACIARVIKEGKV